MMRWLSQRQRETSVTVCAMCRGIYSSLYREWMIQWWGDWESETERDFSYCVCNVSCNIFFSLKGMGNTVIRWLTDWLRGRGRKRLQLLCVQCVVAYILLLTFNDGKAKKYFQTIKKKLKYSHDSWCKFEMMYVRFFLREVAKISSWRNENPCIEFMITWVMKMFSIK